MILAGDIGGTNSRLAIFDDSGGSLKLVTERTIRNVGWHSLEDVIREFLKGVSTAPTRAAFGIAGPISEGRVKMTNLGWETSETDLAKDLNIPVVGLINDLVAHAEAIEVLGDDHFVTLREGKPVAGGNRAVIAAGTGLGEAGLMFDRKTGKYRAFASEGGHADFSPRDEREDALLRFLRTRYKRPMWESVLSGIGVKNVYDFLCQSAEYRLCDEAPIPNVTPPDITAAALAGTSKIAVAAMELAVSLYGAEAGNLALKVLATAGVYIGGGIAPRIVQFMKSSKRLDSFNAHSVPAVEAILSKIPVKMINTDASGLYGAANYASRL
jgi:glucokinase